MKTNHIFKEQRIVFTGDLYINGGVEISRQLASYMQTKDYVVTDLEAPILGRPGKAYKKSGPSLYQISSEVMPILKHININIAACANNHIFDFGEEGLKQTIKKLKELNIHYLGAGRNLEEAKKMLRINGTKFKLINAAEEEFGYTQGEKPGYYSLYNDQIISDISRETKLGFEVIAIIHGGGEMSPFPSSYFIKRSKEIIDAGAKLVVGHHSHVPFGYEMYGNGYIYYGLGNFIHTFYKAAIGTVLEVDLYDKEIKHLNLREVIYRNNSVFVEDLDNELKKQIKLFNSAVCSSKNLERFLNRQARDMFEEYYKSYFERIFKSKQGDIEEKDSLLLMNLLNNRSHLEFVRRGLNSVYGHNNLANPEVFEKKYRQMKEYISRNIIRA